MNPERRPRLPEPALPFPDGNATVRLAETREDAEDCNNGTGNWWDFCPNCSARLVSQKCKYRCTRCHYYMSCSDFD